MAVASRQQEVLDALRVVQDPDLHRDIVSLGFVQNLNIDPGGEVAFDINLTTPACPVKDELKNQARMAVANLAWVTDVRIKMTASTAVARGQGGDGVPLIPRVKNVVAVASGKGGVGKSTTSVNVALALSQTGARVGLLDADIYGPNVPLMMGLKDKPEVQGHSGTIQPVMRYGIKLVSIGFFLDESKPVIWRGPMVHGAIQQFLRDFDWGDLDYLVVDLPPGTGDAPLSLAQLIPLSGVVIVTTPQDVALQDVAKGMAMFKQLEVPVIGVIENMSYFVCPNCSEKHELFGRGGGQRIAHAFGVPFLGQVPLQPNVRTGSDEGQPVVMADPDSPAAEGFRAVAGAVARQVSVLAYQARGNFIPLGGLTLRK
ncbi:MAG TPA: Mrp/NBP35 family ATP-binding protein [Chloroflexota bacterium]|jgi:ATP-binding protein involved in chromosome partitioning|nr:Mrp/NBP35 family ATP-binding protein [Chloroflexota bacterium]